MAKNLKRKIVPSAVGDRQKDHLWTLARQVGDPVDRHAYATGWKETARPVGVPERILIFTRDSRAFLLAAMPRNCHRRFVLIIALKGAGQICVDERIFKLGAGQAFLLFPFQFHHYISLQESGIRWIYIMFDLARADSLESRRNQPWYFTPEAAHILTRLLGAVPSRNPARAIRAAEAQLWLAQFLNQSSVQGTRPPSSSPAISTEIQKWLDRIRDFLSCHLNRSFKLEDMAREIGCSGDYLRHQFKEHFKISLGRYVAQMRLKKAEGLLRENVLNISGVAQACGYSSLYAFSRKFHAAMGCSPRDYRLRLNKGR